MYLDQGSQFTGTSWIMTLTKADSEISMNAQGRYFDSIFSERLRGS